MGISRCCESTATNFRLAWFFVVDWLLVLLITGSSVLEQKPKIDLHRLLARINLSQRQIENKPSRRVSDAQCGCHRSCLYSSFAFASLLVPTPTPSSLKTLVSSSDKPLCVKAKKVMMTMMMLKLLHNFSSVSHTTFITTIRYFQAGDGDDNFLGGVVHPARRPLPLPRQLGMLYLLWDDAPFENLATPANTRFKTPAKLFRDVTRTRIKRARRTKQSEP